MVRSLPHNTTGGCVYTMVVKEIVSIDRLYEVQVGDFFFFFQAEDGIRDKLVTGVQTCALPIWKANGDAGAGGATRRGADLDPRAVRVGDPAGDREAQAGALRLPPRLVSPVEALEHVGELRGGDPNPRVRDDDGRPAVHGCNVEPDATARGRELDGVVEHDQEQLTDQSRITGDPRLFERADVDPDRLVLRDRAHGVHGARRR